MISGVLFLCLVLEHAINGSSGSPVPMTRSLANRKVWEAILYGYVVDPNSPSYLERGDQIFDVKSLKDEVISIISDGTIDMEVDYSDSEKTAAENLAVGMNVEASYGAFSAAASMEVSSSSESSIKTVRLDAVTKALKYEVKAVSDFLNNPELFLTDSFKRTVKTHSFEHIEKNVGVFYATKLDLGGELRKSYVMQATREDNEFSVRAELEASYNSGLLGVSASVNTEYGTRSSNSDAQIKIEWHARGGDTSVWFGAPLDQNQEGIEDIKNEWRNTITDDNLYQFDFRLGYVWDLIKKVDMARGIAYKEYLEAKWDEQYNAFKPTRFLSGERCGYIRHESSGKCVHPQGGSAQSPPGTKIVIHPGCNEERLYFCATSGGETEIKQPGSGLCVQPNSGSNAPPDNEPLVLRVCGYYSSKFKFIEGGFIQHVASGKCWHPLGGGTVPDDETEIVLHSGCGKNSIRFSINPVN